MTLGSLINFCDLLMAGGTSREDHSEVGSGFIHFNFTPWGKSGDKATPSLIGDVTAGVFLRQRRIFLGGQAGMVGPRAVGYGSMTGAGQVVRRDVGAGQLSIQVARAVDEPLERPMDARVAPVVEKNVAYIAQLRALEAFYVEARLGRARHAGRADLVRGLRGSDRQHRRLRRRARDAPEVVPEGARRPGAARSRRAGDHRLPAAARRRGGRRRSRQVDQGPRARRRRARAGWLDSIAGDVRRAAGAGVARGSERATPHPHPCRKRVSRRVS